MRPALLVIDAQSGILEGRSPAYRAAEVIANIRVLLERARAAGAPVVFMQHDGDDGSSLAVGAPGWHIHRQVAPREGELVIRKRASDSFHQTALLEQLRAAGCGRLIVTGCRTEMCVDTTVRRATSLGFDVTLVHDAHTTTESAHLPAAQIVEHHNAVLDDFGTDDHAVVLAAAADVAF